MWQRENSRLNLLTVTVVQLVSTYSLLTAIESNRFSYTPGEGALGNCSLPLKWIGTWSIGDLPGNAPLVVMNGSSRIIEKTVQTCVKIQDDQYIFKEYDDRNQPCYRCMHIFQQHPNVIQYRESECGKEATFQYCADMSTSSSLFSLFRVNAKPEPCPFAERRMTFAYSTDGRHCPYQERGSIVEACSDVGSVILKYQACQNVEGTEKFQEELNCIGSWADGSETYFVGKVNSSRENEVEFKCFVLLEQHKSGTSSEVTGYRMTRSGDTGSCANAREGSWTYDFTVQEEHRPPFPPWLDPDETGESRWSALNRTFLFAVAVTGGKIQKVPIRLHPSQNNAVSEHKSLNYQFTASKIENLTENYARLRVTETIGCQHLNVCMDLYKRDDSVVEFEFYHRTAAVDGVTSCHHKVKVDPYFTYTLVRDRPRPIPCPLKGVFLLDIPSLSTHAENVDKCFNDSEAHAHGGDAQHFLEIGCKEPSRINFYTRCQHEKPLTPGEGLQLVSGMDCIASWEEENKVFMIANNTRFGVPGYRCLELTKINDSDAYSVFISLDNCKPSSNQRLINWTFNANKFSNCDYVQLTSDKNSPHSSATILRGVAVTLSVILIAQIKLT